MGGLTTEVALGWGLPGLPLTARTIQLRQVGRLCLLQRPTRTGPIPPGPLGASAKPWLHLYPPVVELAVRVRPLRLPLRLLGGAGIIDTGEDFQIPGHVAPPPVRVTPRPW